MKSLHKKIIVLCFVLIIASMVLFVEPLRSLLGQAFALLSSLDLGPLKDFIRSFGWAGPLVSFILMLVQSLAAPLPSFLLTFANAALWGWAWGALLSWTSAMAGAALCFALARLYGRDLVLRLTNKQAIADIDAFFVKHGSKSVLIARLLPFVSFDIVSYAAGLTGMSLPAFLIATGLGQLPATLVYSYVGQELTVGAKALMTGLLILFAVTIIVAILRSYFKEAQAGKNSSA